MTTLALLLTTASIMGFPFFSGTDKRALMYKNVYFAKCQGTT